MAADIPTMEIRRTTPEDAALLASTAERLFRESFSDRNDPRQIEAYCSSHYSEAIQRRELLDPRRDAFFAIADGVVIGFALLCFGTRPLIDVPFDRPPIELERFYVAHSHHGRGVAQRLMERCFEQARERGASIIWLGVWQDNARAIAFYRKCGFEIVAEQPFMLGSEEQQDYVMAKVIG